MSLLQHVLREFVPCQLRAVDRWSGMAGASSPSSAQVTATATEMASGIFRDQGPAKGR